MTRWRWVVSGIVIGLVVFAAGRVDWPVAMHALSRASPMLIAAAMLANALSLVLRGARWWIFLRPAGAPSLALAVRGAVVGSGFNNLLIANGGDAARAVLVARETGISATSVVATLALDRMFDPFCFVLLLFGATFAVPLPAGLASSRLIAGAAVLGGILGLTALARTSKRYRYAFLHDGNGWRARVERFRGYLECLSTSLRLSG